MNKFLGRTGGGGEGSESGRTVACSVQVLPVGEGDDLVLIRVRAGVRAGARVGAGAVAGAGAVVWSGLVSSGLIWSGQA